MEPLVYFWIGPKRLTDPSTVDSLKIRNSPLTSSVIFRVTAITSKRPRIRWSTNIGVNTRTLLYYVCYTTRHGKQQRTHGDMRLNYSYMTNTYLTPYRMTVWTNLT